MMGDSGAQRGRDEAAASETLQLVALAEGLTDPLEAFRQDADQLVGPEQALGVGGARQRVPVLRAMGATKGVAEDESAPSSRMWRWAGWSSSSASASISASSGRVPEWLATTRAPPSSGTFSRPRISTRNHRR